MNESGRFTFTLLGTVRGWRGTGELPLAGPQQRTALAMLLLAGGQPVGTEELIDGLWGGQCPRAAATTVRTYVSRIRTLLEPGHREAGGSRLLVSAGSAYALRLPPGSLDVTLAEQEVAAAGEARRRGDPVRARMLLRRAADRRQGVPLTGLTGPFADTTRERLTQWYLGVLESGVELDLELCDARTAVTELTAAIAEHPLRESLRLLLMRALYQCGRQAEALEAFGDARSVLAGELGIDPDPRLFEMYERILRSDPALLPEPAGAAPSAPGGSPPAETRAVPVPAQLPADTGDFTGRDQLVAELTGHLAESAGSAVRVCAVSGIGGTGKTALAVHVAHRLRARFPAGQLFVDLAGVTENPASPHAVLGQLLHALGVPEPGVPEEPAARAALYRSLLAEQHMLVVLDNAADAEQIKPLLPGHPGCAVIVTSRARLTAISAHPVDLDPFRPGEALDLLTSVIGGKRVLAEPAAARELMATCGYLPLAVRIVACRILARPGTSIADCLDRLSDERRRLDQLRTGDLDVRACFQLGYDQLDPGQARAFRLLALPESETVSLSFAAALLGTDEFEAERVLDDLIHAGLLQSPKSGRYRYHDLLRLFARELCARTDPAERTDGALGGLLAFLLATVGNAYRVVRPGHRIAELLDETSAAGVEFPGARAAYAWFDQERDSVLQVVRQSARRAPLVGPAADVLLGLDPLLERAYAWGDTVEPARAVVNAAERAGLAHAEAAARYLLGGALWQLSRPMEGSGHIERAARLCREHDDPVVLAEVLNVRALIAASHDGHNSRSVALLNEAREFQRVIGNMSGEANTLGSIAFAHVMLDEPAKAAEVTATGLALYRRLGDRMGEAQTLIHRGTALRMLGDTDAAMNCYGRSLELSRDLGMRFLEANLLHRIAEIRLIQGDPAAAVTVADQARALSHEISMVRTEARALTTLGRALAALGRRDRAMLCLRESVAIYRRLGLAEVDDAERALSELAAATIGQPVQPPRVRPESPAPSSGGTQG
ncbi:BTAD domain-containing putative transcriptional regulator [Streptomyces sp. CAU 1734]|uniref:AfsR/SARP family transcriptional regulator n=1 Tax=Streptomyces sp. CAU 1734 TaxID=3140360 RepID=UPI0032603DB3